MKHLYDTKNVLKTDTRVGIEVNYNKSVYSMTKPGEPIFYKSPEDASEHPMYIDAEGRVVPVSSTTLQPMADASGYIIDKNGDPVPSYERMERGVHFDDVRIAVTGVDIKTKDEDDKDIYVAFDGTIIPTGDDGVPGTVIVDGVVWAVGEDGTPYAPLNKVYLLNSYAPPVRADNYPVNRAGVKQPLVNDQYEEYFPISSIVEGNRPARRGVLYAWAATDQYDSPAIVGADGYDGARYYTVSEDSGYKYWVSPTWSDANATVMQQNIYTFDNSWTAVKGTGTTVSTNFISADFLASDFASSSAYFQKIMSLDDNAGYDMTFKGMVQSPTMVEIELIEWGDTQTTNPDVESGSLLKRTTLKTMWLPGGRETNVTLDITPTSGSVSQAIRIIPVRTMIPTTSKIKLSLSSLSVNKSYYAISSTAPRAIYDRPVRANKIVIGIDYSVDGSSGIDKHSNKPAEYDVRVFRDRGDGVFTWQTVATNPDIDDSGHINLYFDGTNWAGESPVEAEQQIMGIQLVVFGMKRRDTQLRVMEISARRVFDVSEFFMSYSTSSNIADESFVLPFGTVSGNSGEVALSNHDGRFNSDNKYLLNRGSLNAFGLDTFTNVPNPFYQILNESVYVTVDTATFDPTQPDDKDYIRMLTGRTPEGLRVGNKMEVSLSVDDSAEFLSKKTVGQVFYSGNKMSIIQVLYMLLDMAGFTSVKFSDEDKHFATHIDYFWTPKNENNIWDTIADICRATQTVAFFDNDDFLNFMSLKGMYERALSAPPDFTLTSEDTDGVISNIIDMGLESSVAANKITVNYREVKEPEKTPSGRTPMSVLWEPGGTQVLRAGALTEDLDNLKPADGGSKYFTLPSGSTATWPFEGMVQVEGEMIKYDAKEYKYYDSKGVGRLGWVTTEDDRKALDKNNPEKAFKNVYTGRLRISERGAEGTTIKRHVRNKINEFNCRYKNGSDDVKYDYRSGISISRSWLHMASGPSAPNSGIKTVTTGSYHDDRPTHYGTQMKITHGGTAGMAIAQGYGDDGIYVALTTTKQIESMGRPRGELHVFTRKAGAIKYYGIGVNVPVSVDQVFTMDVSVRSTSHSSYVRSYAGYYEISLKYGDRGNYVRTLQTALNEGGEKLVVDGIFGTATKNAVIRLQRRLSLAADGIVNIEEWKALEKGNSSDNYTSVNVILDGNYSYTVAIPNSELSFGYNGGRFGLFTRGSTKASFEYFYGVRGREDVEFDESGFWDYVSGGYVSDQLDAGWIYNKKVKTLMQGGKKYQRQVISNQLMLEDFGPYAHEVRDFEVEFKDEEPALSSFAYFSNERSVDIISYVHMPFGAKFRLANKARQDAILEGEDSTVFGSENSVAQKFMIYGTALSIDDERSITVSDETSVKARGADALTIDVDWMQSQASAKKFASHIVEAMSSPVDTYSVEIFGNAAIRQGHVVNVYNPQHGLPDTNNRLFVYGVKHRNDGAHSTTVELRTVVDGGLRQVKLSDVLAKNYNAMNENPMIDRHVKVGNTYQPYGYTFRSGVDSRFASPLGGGSGAVLLKGKGQAAYDTAMLLSPYDSDKGRFAHRIGDYYLFTVNVTAKTDIAVRLVAEGWPTTGSMLASLSSKTFTLKAGETKDVTLTGRYSRNSEVPEVSPVIRILDPKNTADGAKTTQSVLVNSAYYRSSQNKDDIYPVYGGDKYR